MKNSSASNPHDIQHSRLLRKIDSGLRRSGSEHSCWASLGSFRKCGSDSDSVRWCVGCGTDHPLKWRCSKKWCPHCNWAISQKRREKLSAFSREIHFPQHLVLTQKNFAHVSHAKIIEHQRNLVKFRRLKVFENVKGGCLAVEMTNKGTGWHLHSHWLIDCSWIDYAECAVEWGRLCNQEFGIVHGRAITGAGYEKEICKYVVKPGEMLKWTNRDVCDFIEAIWRTRFFFTFGSMKEQAKRINALIESEKIEYKFPCTECGAETTEFVLHKSWSTEKRIQNI